MIRLLIRFDHPLLHGDAGHLCELQLMLVDFLIAQDLEHKFYEARRAMNFTDVLAPLFPDELRHAAQGSGTSSDEKSKTKKNAVTRGGKSEAHKHNKPTHNKNNPSISKHASSEVKTASHPFSLAKSTASKQ